jgi:hypothetical protein
MAASAKAGARMRLQNTKEEAADSFWRYPSNLSCIPNKNNASGAFVAAIAEKNGSKAVRILDTDPL